MTARAALSSSTAWIAAGVVRVGHLGRREQRASCRRRGRSRRTGSARSCRPPCSHPAAPAASPRTTRGEASVRGSRTDAGCTVAGVGERLDVGHGRRDLGGALELADLAGHLRRGRRSARPWRRAEPNTNTASEASCVGRVDVAAGPGGLEVEAVEAAGGVRRGDDALGGDALADERAGVAGALDLGDRLRDWRVVGGSAGGSVGPPPAGAVPGVPGLSVRSFALSSVSLPAALRSSAVEAEVAGAAAVSKVLLVP